MSGHRAACKETLHLVQIIQKIYDVVWAYDSDVAAKKYSPRMLAALVQSQLPIAVGSLLIFKALRTHDRRTC